MQLGFDPGICENKLKISNDVENNVLRSLFKSCNFSNFQHVLTVAEDIVMTLTKTSHHLLLRIVSVSYMNYIN